MNKKIIYFNANKPFLLLLGVSPMVLVYRWAGSVTVRLIAQTALMR